MNSDEEKALFTKHGWYYDYIDRMWVSPVGPVITQDELMIYTTNPAGEEELKALVRMYGVETK